MDTHVRVFMCVSCESALPKFLWESHTRKGSFKHICVCRNTPTNPLNEFLSMIFSRQKFGRKDRPRCTLHTRWSDETHNKAMMTDDRVMSATKYGSCWPFKVYAKKQYMPSSVLGRLDCHWGKLQVINIDWTPRRYGSRDGLVGYDAALTQLRSRVRFPVLVLFLLLSLFVGAVDW